MEEKERKKTEIQNRKTEIRNIGDMNQKGEGTKQNYGFSTLKPSLFNIFYQ
jgi:hypothetical protein